MSLKAFHIFFIVLSALMCFGIAAFLLQAYGTDGETAKLAEGVLCVGAGIGLLEYGRRFLKKTKAYGYM
jgi:hypothetical protein